LGGIRVSSVGCYEVHIAYCAHLRAHEYENAFAPPLTTTMSLFDVATSAFNVATSDFNKAMSAVFNVATSDFNEAMSAVEVARVALRPRQHA
jgi:hypothetical protein